MSLLEKNPIIIISFKYFAPRQFGQNHTLDLSQMGNNVTWISFEDSIYPTDVRVLVILVSDCLTPLFFFLQVYGRYHPQTQQVYDKLQKDVYVEISKEVEKAKDAENEK